MIRGRVQFAGAWGLTGHVDFADGGSRCGEGAFFPQAALQSPQARQRPAGQHNPPFCLGHASRLRPQILLKRACATARSDTYAISVPDSA
eukprot:3210921-Rhodomonas_salina.2